MSSRSTTRVVSSLTNDSADRPIGATELPIELLPALPFDLSSSDLVARAVVRDTEDAERVLLAAARGAALIIEVQLDDTRRVTFLDDLSRVSDVRVDGPQTSTRLTDDQMALLDGLAAGRTLKEIAESLGLSRRTATRRLVEVKELLGVATTVEAVIKRTSGAA